MINPAELTLTAPRWVRKDARIYDFSRCRFCGSGYGCLGKADKWSHTPAVCLACGTVQCSEKETCAVCVYGLLATYHTRQIVCGYTGCRNRAVAKAPRVKYVCVDHLDRPKLGKSVTLGDYISAALAGRDKGFVYVQAPLPEPPGGYYEVWAYLRSVDTQKYQDELRTLTGGSW